jgi:hypothetical protein
MVFPTQVMRRLQDNMAHKIQNRHRNRQTQRKTWVTFMYQSPLIRIVTNLFKHTDLNIAYRATNTLCDRLRNTQETQDKFQKR